MRTSEPAAEAATSAGAAVFLRLIAVYQRWLSPMLGPRCRFYPSCSAYAALAIARHGAFRGSMLGVVRLVKCQPFHPGGVDHVPATRADGRKGRTPSPATSWPAERGVR